MVTKHSLKSGKNWVSFRWPPMTNWNMFWKPRLQLWERPHRKWPNPNRYIFLLVKFRYCEKATKFEESSHLYLNSVFKILWLSQNIWTLHTDVLFLFKTNFNGVLSFRCLGQAHKTWQVSFTISKYQFTILRFLSLLHKLMGNDIRMIIWHKFYKYSRNFQFLRKS